jgi:hypothetical protein
MVLVLTNFYLVQVCAEAMKTNPTLEFWLRSGWNSAATVVSVAATVIGMVLGTATRPTPDEERTRVEAFFADLEKPFLYEERKERPLSPFKIIGFMLVAFGAMVAAVSLLVLVSLKDTRAFHIDFVVAMVLVVVGLLMRMGKKTA